MENNIVVFVKGIVLFSFHIERKQNNLEKFSCFFLLFSGGSRGASNFIWIFVALIIVVIGALIFMKIRRQRQSIYLDIHILFLLSNICLYFYRRCYYGSSRTTHG